MTAVLLISSVLIIAAYTTAVCIKQKGVPYSISATFYKLVHPYWFWAAMSLTAFTLTPVMVEAGKGNTEWAAFLALIGMLMVGAAPNFKEATEGKIHITGAVMCLGFSQLWVLLNQPLVLYLWMAWWVYTIIYMANHISGDAWRDFVASKPMFWVEVTALATTYLTILICL